jgi:simple sugar transport system ATP-binding protein
MAQTSMTPAAATAPDIPLVEARDVHKRFGSTYALRGVGLSLRPGRCHGLVGRNGAGKSTLVSILSGLTAADSGQISFVGRPAPPPGAVTAWRAHIATVYQHPTIVPELSVAENVFLGRQPRRGFAVDWRRMRADTRAIMASWGFELDAGQPCAALTVEQRQIVEIARALAAGSTCLLLDEPTAALERAATRRLFERVRALVEGGVAVLYISHHLTEVFEICDEVTVLRDGELVLNAPVTELSTDSIVTAMVHGRNTARTDDQQGTDGQDGGRDPATLAAGVTIGAARPDRPGPDAPVLLSVANLRATSPRGEVDDCTLRVRVGERLGVTGLLGSGVATLGRVIAGMQPPRSGQVLLDGRPLRTNSRRANLRAGVGYIPEDRAAEGFVAQLGVAENITLSIADRIAPRFGLLTKGQRALAAAPLRDALSIVSAGAGQPVGELSGGNQQKVTVARALARDPELVVALTPTRGVDVASKALLLGALADTTADGHAALLLLSDEIDDLVICDRVVVMVRGRIAAEFSEPPFDRERLVAAIEGLSDGSVSGSADRARADRTSDSTSEQGRTS